MVSPTIKASVVPGKAPVVSILVLLGAACAVGIKAAAVIAAAAATAALFRFFIYFSSFPWDNEVATSQWYPGPPRASVAKHSSARRFYFLVALTNLMGLILNAIPSI